MPVLTDRQTDILPDRQADREADRQADSFVFDKVKVVSFKAF